MTDLGTYAALLKSQSDKSRSRRNNVSTILDALLSSSGPTGVESGAGGTGPGLRAAPGGAGGGNVDGWINEALRVLKLDASYTNGIRNMIMKESSGNPRAINNWDSNAKRGTPSKGLMQTIDPTFRQWALPGYDRDVYDPVSNIIAGVRYALNRYGPDMLRSGGRRDTRGNYKGY